MSIEKGAIREAYGCTAVGVRNEKIHPECRTDAEMTMTVRFFGANDLVGGECPRCGGALAQPPRGVSS